MIDRVALVISDHSEEVVAYMIRAKRINELGRPLEIISNYNHPVRLLLTLFISGLFFTL
jgi:hypothetical protein